MVSSFVRQPRSLRITWPAVSTSRAAAPGTPSAPLGRPVLAVFHRYRWLMGARDAQLRPEAGIAGNDDLTAANSLLGFIERLLGASDDAELGGAVLDVVADLVRPSARALYLFEPPDRHPRCVAAVDVSELFLHRYERDGRHSDPILARALASGQVACSTDLMSAADWRRHLEGLRVSAHMHRFDTVMIAPVMVEECVAGTINVADEAGDRPVTARERQALGLIARATGLALAQRRSDARTRASTARMGAAFDRAPVALAITTPAEERPIANAAALDLMRDLADPDAALYEVLARSGAPSPAPRVTKADLSGGGHAELVGVSSPLDGEPGAAVTVLERAGAQHSAAALALLTPREREVALLVAEGLTDAEVAQRLSLSPYTVGQHLKRAYTKLDVHTRVALARLVMMGGSRAG